MVALSQDVIFGNDQKMDTFWSRITEHFTQHSTCCEERNSRNIQQREVYPGGTTFEDRVRDAMALYKEQHGEEFKFFEPWTILCNAPNFKIYIVKGKR